MLKFLHPVKSSLLSKQDSQSLIQSLGTTGQRRGEEETETGEESQFPITTGRVTRRESRVSPS
jgi:hypothetical protein